MKKLAWIASVILLLCSLRCTSDQGKPIPEELRNRIVYLCDKGICTINADGSRRRVIVPSDSGGPFSNPTWSPDKQMIAFTGQIAGRSRIMLVNSDGSNQRVFHLPDDKESKKARTGSKRKVLRPVGKDPRRGKVIPPVVALAPYDFYFSDWSARGDYLCGTYSAGFDYPGATVIMDTQGKGLFRVEGAPDSRFCGDRKIVLWSPSGPWGSGENHLICYDLDTKKKVPVAVDSILCFDTPVPSHDGKKIAYTFSSVKSRGDLWIVDIDGSNRLRLLGEEDFDDQYLSNISFSPDGHHILFIPVKKSGYGRELRGAIHIVDLDGSNLHTITNVIVKWRGGISWSPDGTQIVFTSAKDGNDELYIVNVDGTGLKRLTNNTTMDCCADW
jgi:dipeptidyl aminopeptidase/acylaminoacyl peptidase